MIVSAGANSRGHFPHSGLKDDCQRLGIKLLTTSEQGTIEVKINGEDQRIYGYAKNQGNPLIPFTAVPIATE